MQIGDEVRAYCEGDWFNRGKIIEIEDDTIVVDFIDWEQQYDVNDLKETVHLFCVFWVPMRPGTIIRRYT